MLIPGLLWVLTCDHAFQPRCFTPDNIPSRWILLSAFYRQRPADGKEVIGLNSSATDENPGPPRPEAGILPSCCSASLRAHGKSHQHVWGLSKP